MVILLHTETQAIVRVDKGEDVIKELTHFADTYEIGSASLSGIGSAQDITISFYDSTLKKYLDKQIVADLEIVSLMGNIGWLDVHPVVHLHGVFSDREYQTVGGHIKELIVSLTCEVVVSCISERVQRRYDEVTGLNLFSL